METTEIAGKTVLITGASRGIGAEAARAFVKAGANVVLTARSAGALSELADDLGEAALAVACDVSDRAAVVDAVAAGETAFGQIDILIGNAGRIDPIAHLHETDPDDWGKTIDVNLKGVMYGMHAVLPGMMARGGGTIITTSSGAAHGPVEAWSAYCASKAGAFMLTRMVDREYRSRGIRCLGLSPGTVATEMQKTIKASGINPVSQLNWSDHIPADWPAQALVWMSTSAADNWLGQDVSLREDDIRRAVGLI